MRAAQRLGLVFLAACAVAASVLWNLVSVMGAGLAADEGSGDQALAPRVLIALLAKAAMSL